MRHQSSLTEGSAVSVQLTQLSLDIEETVIYIITNHIINLIEKLLLLESPNTSGLQQ